MYLPAHYKMQGELVSFEGLLSKIISLEESQVIVTARRLRELSRSSGLWRSFFEIGWDSMWFQ